ncbi:MAG: translation initiation factor IF-5A [Candidatus Micrarchaeota archaeon]
MSENSMSDKSYASAKDIKIGRYLLIEEIPCRVVDIETSKTGKHGSAKMRVTGIGIFDGQKKTLLTSADADVEVPMIDRKNAQIVSVSGKNAQVMDSVTYEVYNLDLPDDMVALAASGKEVELIQAMGRRKIERIK